MPIRKFFLQTKCTKFQVYCNCKRHSDLLVNLSELIRRLAATLEACLFLYHRMTAITIIIDTKVTTTIAAILPPAKRGATGVEDTASRNTALVGLSFRCAI